MKLNLIQNLKISHNLQRQDSLNSTGTVSRKTSTASDYTPEHTIFQDGKLSTQATIDNSDEFLVIESSSSSSGETMQQAVIQSDESSSSLSNTAHAQDEGMEIKMEDEIVDVGTPVNEEQEQQTVIDVQENECIEETDKKIFENNLQDVTCASDMSSMYFNAEIQPEKTESSDTLQTTLTYAEAAKSPKKNTAMDAKSEDSLCSSSQYTDTLTSLPESTSSGSSDVRVGQRIELKICLLRQNSEQLVAVSKGEEIECVVKKEGEITVIKPPDNVEDSPTKSLKVPQRKISRFLVSPVLDKLDVPEKHESVEDEVKKESEEGDGIQTLHEARDTADIDSKEVSTDVSSEALVDKEVSDTLSAVSTDLTIASPADSTEGPVCGPEMINTLEQLKISLQNITHAHVLTTVGQPATPQPTGIITQPILQPTPVKSLSTGQAPFSEGAAPPSMQTSISSTNLLANQQQQFPASQNISDSTTESNISKEDVTPRSIPHSSTEPQLSTVGNQNQQLTYQQSVDVLPQEELINDNLAQQEVKTPPTTSGEQLPNTTASLENLTANPNADEYNIGQKDVVLEQASVESMPDVPNVDGTSNGGPDVVNERFVLFVNVKYFGI